MAGARAVQQDILAKYPTAPLRVYTVWFAMVPGDSRAGWRSGVLPDARVTHFWDAERVTGRWFAQHLDGEGGLMWDTYLLYGPEARWDTPTTAPLPLVSQGATVLRERAELHTRLLPLLFPATTP